MSADQLFVLGGGRRETIQQRRDLLRDASLELAERLEVLAAGLELPGKGPTVGERTTHP